ncbi:MAG: DUF3108 domain-containing protein, partial [Sphingobacteriia bacterium]|nr:DUF3108 domain-containing protein [Sphingobacteriia bacterium]
AIIALLLTSAGYQENHLAQIGSTLEDASDKLPTKNNFAFRPGEKLTYRLHYGIINAGEAVLEVKPDVLTINGRQIYHIVGTGYTTGSTDWFFKVRDRYETYLDKDALLPWYFVRRVEEGGYKFSQDYSFNHFTKKVDIGNNQKYDIPGDVQDMVSAFYAARNMDLSRAKTGDVMSMICFMDKELWPMKIKLIGRETIATDIGEIRCLKFRPIVQRGRVFKQEEDMTVWISDDANHLPVRAQADILVGSIKMDLSAVMNLANPLAKAN